MLFKKGLKQNETKQTDERNKEDAQLPESNSTFKAACGAVAAAALFAAYKFWMGDKVVGSVASAVGVFMLFAATKLYMDSSGK